ncbi:hypothetical protein YB2330_004607 [Saitoella coloradoensis]
MPSIISVTDDIRDLFGDRDTPPPMSPPNTPPRRTYHVVEAAARRGRRVRFEDQVTDRGTGTSWPLDIDAIVTNAVRNARVMEPVLPVSPPPPPPGAEDPESSGFNRFLQTFVSWSRGSEGTAGEEDERDLVTEREQYLHRCLRRLWNLRNREREARVAEAEIRQARDAMYSQDEISQAFRTLESYRIRFVRYTASPPPAQHFACTGDSELSLTNHLLFRNAIRGRQALAA